MPVKLGQGVVFRPGTAFDERWAPNQYLSGFVTSIAGDDASIVVFPDVYAPFYEMRVKRDDALSEDRTWTPAVGESQTMPEAPSDGQIYGRRNQAWTPISGEDQGYVQSVIISDTQPSGGLSGMAWFDTTINNFYVFEQGKWVEPAHINPPEEISVNITSPYISGIIDVDELLTCSTGDWTSQPLAFTYQWMRNSVPLVNQTANTYTIAVSDIGNQLTCVVIAMNKVGVSQPTTSNIISVTVPSIVDAPMISGQVAVGGLLSCSNGSWNTGSTITYTYQWMRGASPIAGAAMNTYTILAGDSGNILSCVVTATNLIGSSSVSSDIVSIAPPSSITAPIISGGYLFTGTTLSCSTGEWTNIPNSYLYQWKRNGAAIASASASTYLLIPLDLGTNITCDVTASNSIGSASPSTSNTLAIKASTTLDPTTVIGASLEGGNLTVRHAMQMSAGSGAKSTAYKFTGKWCFQCILTNIEGDFDGVGILLENNTLDDMNTGKKGAFVFKTGKIYSNEADTGKTLGALIDGDILHWAVDLDNELIWVRKITGSWNGDPTASPGGTGGVGCGIYSAIGAATFAPAANFGGDNTSTNELITFNFGGSALSFSIPGFISGWPVGAN